MISRERGKDREVFTCGTYLRSFVTQIFHNGQPSHDGDRKIFEVMTSTLPKKEPIQTLWFSSSQDLNYLAGQYFDFERT